MREYFYHKEYKYIYLSTFCFSFANALIGLFSVVMLYKGGMPIYKILFLYGLRFGLMGICTPLYLKVSSKIGMAKCYLLANILRIMGSYMLLYNNVNNIIIFLLVMSIPGALTNPMTDAFSNKYVESVHRGKFNSINNISRILGQALASMVLTLGIITQNNFLLLILVSIFFVLVYIFVSKIDYKPRIENKHILNKTMKYILNKKSNFKVIYSLRTNHIIERLFIPLYLYIVLQDFVSFSTVIIISLLFQLVTVIIVGKLTDRNTKNTNNILTFFKIVITSIYLFLKNPFIISINKTINDNFEKAYETSVQSSIQNIMKNEDENNEILSAVGQMSLCFTEIIVFFVLGVVSMYIDKNVFYIIFILSIISTIMINSIIKNYETK